MKAPGSALKIVHGESTNNEDGYTSRDSDEFDNFLGNGKFITMDPLKVLNLFNKIRKAVSTLLYINKFNF